ncbi:MAG: polysaccharide deacetylase family protein, partial [Bacteroidota bacterium]
MIQRFLLVACFISLSSAILAQNKLSSFPNKIQLHGGIERMDTTKPVIYLMFTGGDYNDGGKYIRQVLDDKNVPAHFFFTGDFYRKSANRRLIKGLVKDGHYLGPHSDQHLLYAAWEDRDSLLVDKPLFTKDLLANYEEMKSFGIEMEDAPYFMPPYEWYNQKISDWTAELGLTLVNFSPGTRSNADYTTPDMGKRYLSSDYIYQRIFEYEKEDPAGLNGFFLLVHIGTHPFRKDKFYYKL